MPYFSADSSQEQPSLDEVALNLSQGALQAAILDLSQHECDPTHLRRPGNDTEATQPESSKNSETINPNSLTQKSFGDTSSFKTSNSSQYYSQGVSLISQTTSEFGDKFSRMSGDLSQHVSETVGSEYGTRSSTESEGMLFMAQSEKDSRPATVIERPLTEGHNQMDNITSVPAAQAVITVGNVHEYTQSSQFDHSIKYGHGQNPRETLGDTLLYTDKKPLVSSTPQVYKSDQDSKQSGVNSTRVTGQSLQKTLENLGRASDSGSESNTNIAKFMKKAGVDNYVTAAERQNIIDDLIGLKSSEVSMDTVIEGKRNKSPVMRGATKSPGGFHEMIPDTPSFRRDHDLVKGSRSGSPSQRSRISQGEAEQQSLEFHALEQTSLGRYVIKTKNCIKLTNNFLHW